MQTVRSFQDEVVPLLGAEWLDAIQCQASIAAPWIAGRRHLCLVDCASFETMPRLGTTTAFSFDPHFKEQGFTCIP